MDAQRVVNLLQRLLPMQSVSLHLAPSTCLRTLGLLYHLKSTGVIGLEIPGNIKIQRLLENADSGQCAHVTYHVRNLRELHPRTLHDLLEGVQRIDPPSHGASAMQQRRQKTVQTAAQNIVDHVLSRDFVHEMWKAGIRVTGTFSALADGTPAVTFTVLLSDTVVSSVVIDSFSGRLILNDTLSDDVFARPEQVQQHIVNLVDTFLES